jgi:hypothetical protein
MDAEARFQHVCAMLIEHPLARYAVISSDGNRDPVIVTIAIRDRAVCEVAIPKAKWDGTLFLDLLERHGGTNH